MLKRFSFRFQSSYRLFALLLYNVLFIACSQENNNLLSQTTNHSSTSSLRIITLSPHLTENVFLAGLDDYLVGTVAYSNYPETAKKIPRIGNAFAINKEQLLALKPTHIIAWQDSLSNDLRQFIEQHHITLIIDPADSFQDIVANLTQLYQLNPKPTKSNPAQQFQQRLNQLHTYFDKVPKNNHILYLVWHSPLIAIGGKQLINEAIKFCGAKNIYENIPLASFDVNIEDILTQQPSVIITTFSPNHLPKILQQSEIIQLNSDTLSRPSGNIIDGLNELCHQIHSL